MISSLRYSPTQRFSRNNARYRTSASSLLVHRGSSTWLAKSKKTKEHVTHTSTRIPIRARTYTHEHKFTHKNAHVHALAHARMHTHTKKRIHTLRKQRAAALRGYIHSSFTSTCITTLTGRLLHIFIVMIAEYTITTLTSTPLTHARTSWCGSEVHTSLH